MSAWFFLNKPELPVSLHLFVKYRSRYLYKLHERKSVSKKEMEQFQFFISCHCSDNAQIEIFPLYFGAMKAMFH